MKKANVAYEEVAAYCDQQAAKGIDPERITCRQVIDALECNSSTSTISDYIKRWRGEHAEAVLTGIALTDADIASVFMTVKQVIASKCGERERQLIDHAEELNRRLKNTADDLEALLEENRLLTQRTESLEGQLTDAKGTIAILQASLASLVGLTSAPTGTTEWAKVDDTCGNDEDAEPASFEEQVLSCSPLPPEAFGDGDQEPTLMSATGQAGLSFSTAAGNSNEGPKEQPHAQG